MVEEGRKEQGRVQKWATKTGKIAKVESGVLRKKSERRRRILLEVQRSLEGD